MKIMGMKWLFLRMEKKGVSATIETLAMVLLTFAALGIIAGFIVPYVRDGLNKGTECVEYKEHFTFEQELGYNCRNEMSGDFWISVRAETISSEKQDKIKGFLLSFQNREERDSLEIYEGNIPGVSMLNGSTSIAIPKSGEVKTYIYNTGENYTDVEIYTLLKSGRVCEERSDFINLEEKC